jgi:hypothetical protein
VFNGLWDLSVGEERDSGNKPEPHSEWLVRSCSHIELAPIFIAESGRPVNPLTGSTRIGHMPFLFHRDR